MESQQPDLNRAFVTFGRTLRSEGLEVGPDRIARFVTAISHLDPTDLRDLYWAGRSCLVTGIEDVEVFNREFVAFFLGAGADVMDDEVLAPVLSTTLIGETGLEDTHGREAPDSARDTDGSDESLDPGGDIGRMASDVDFARDRSLTGLTDEELAQLGQILSRVVSSFPTKIARRTRAGSRRERLDLRRTVHRSLRREGEFLDRLWRQRMRRIRPVLILIDVSGSMSGYSRALLHFAYVLNASALRTETFTFGTRLTRLTPLLSNRDPNAAVGAAANAVDDWSGGTRIGENLHTLFKDWGDRPGIRGSVVLLFSDGLERGDPEFLETQMRRLSRLTHRIIWINPLKSDSNYLPLARGMRAALPYVDRLVPADSANDLLHLGSSISELVRASTRAPALR